MKEGLSRVLKYSFWTVLAAVLLYFSFRGVDWKEFWKVLGQCSWVMVALAMVSGVLSFIVRALRWRLLLLPDEPQTRLVDCYDGFAIGKLCDFAVPHVGEFVRCGYVRTQRLTYDKALGTVILERTWDILMLGLLVVLLLAFKWSEFGAFFIDSVLEPVAGRLNVSLWLVAGVLLAVVAGGIAAVFAFREKSGFCARIASFVKGLGQGITSCLKMRGKDLFLVLTVVLWFLFLMMSFFIIKALPVDYGLTMVDALFIMLVGSVAGIVPVPGGFGAFHYLVAIALQTVYGIPFEMGIIFATLSHESQAITMMVCGAVSYVHQTLKRK